MQYTLLWSCGRIFLKTNFFRECHKRRAIPPDETSTKTQSAHARTYSYIRARALMLFDSCSVL